jgi:hypothetical protein
MGQQYVVPYPEQTMFLHFFSKSGSVRCSLLPDAVMLLFDRGGMERGTLFLGYTCCKKKKKKKNDL